MCAYISKTKSSTKSVENTCTFIKTHLQTKERNRRNSRDRGGGSGAGGAGGNGGAGGGVDSDLARFRTSHTIQGEEERMRYLGAISAPR